MAPERIILCVDMDYFYAQIEERDNPELKDRPTIVCVYSGRTATSGVVSTANYKARELGVRSGIPIFQAMRILKTESDARFVPVRLDYYREVSVRIMRILKETSDVLETVSIDEAYLDVTHGTRNNFEEAKSLAIKIKNVIREDEKLTCSMGIGPNKLIAKMAAEFQKPDGLTVIRGEEAVDFISPMPVGKLFRVGKKAERKFLEEGVNTIGKLRSLKQEKLIQMFGNALGKYYWNAARGVDFTPVEPRAGHEQISRIATLKADTLDFTDVEEKLKEMVSQIVSDLKKGELLCKTVSAILILKNLQTHTKSKTVEESTNSEEEIYKVAAGLMRVLLDEQELEARRVGIRVDRLSKLQNQQDLGKFLR